MNHADIFTLIPISDEEYSIINNAKICNFYLIEITVRINAKNNLGIKSFKIIKSTFCQAMKNLGI